jgi:hypothetical protein
MYAGTANMIFAKLRRYFDSGRLLLTLVCLLAAMPAVAATGPGAFIVNVGTDNDDAVPGDGACADAGGKCSLRAAIEEGNALSGATRVTPHTITFAAVPEVDISNGSFPTATAPFLITGPVYINGGGLTCLGFSESGQIAAGYGANGADGSTLTLVAIGNCGSDAIDISGHGYNLIGNFIGVDLLGAGKPNTGHGIELSSTHTYGNFVDAGALDTLFQSFPAMPVQGSDVNSFVQNMVTVLVTLDPTTISGNVISANTGNGVNLHSENLGAVFVTGNWIGTDPTGKIAMPNGGDGVNLNGNTFANLITGNVISGNTSNGVNLGGTVFLPNFVMNNLIGPPAVVTAPAAHIGNGMSGVLTTTTPNSSPTNFNPTMLAAIVGPGNIISDNQGAPNSPSFPDVFGTNGAGVYITGASNGIKVIGNTIGMVEVPLGSPQQTNAYGNLADGVIITAGGNTVANNVIAGNKRHGIFVNSSGAISNHITGNTIGQYPAFASDKTLGNGFDGVHIDNGSSTAIGGPNAGDGNTIIFNGRNGVKILNGGANNGWGNLVQANTIYGNAQGNPSAQPNPLPPGMGIGIDLDVTANASDGPHAENIGGPYANLNQAPPVICVGAPGEQAECSGYHKASSAGGTATIDWTIATHGVANFHAEFYKIDSNDDNTASSIVLLGTQDIATTAAGLPDPATCPGGRCTATLSGAAAGAHVLMTITDISDLLSTPGSSGWQTNLKCFLGDNGIILSACLANNTSEFSNVATVVSADASLSNLVPSAGSLAPAFAPAVLIYTDAVTNVASITLTPTTADANATVTVAGNAVTSGSASLPIALNVGANPIDVVVTAQDGTTMQTYTVTVNAVATTFSGTTFTNTGIATALLSGGGPTCSFANTALVGPPAPVPAGVTFPDGLFQFTTSSCTGTITVSVTFPTAFQPNESYWKYGATPGPTPAAWYTLGAANNLVLAGNIATFTITDGGLGDDDLTVNGTIVDAGGPGVQATPVTLQDFSVD